MKEESWWEIMEKPFQPFAWSLWALIFGVILFTSLIHSVLERGYKQAFRRPGDLAIDAYLTSTSYLSGGIDATLYLTPASRVLAVGFAFFVTVCIASYTANTASFLLRSDGKTAEANNLEEAIGKGKLICYPEPVSQALELQNPVLRSVGKVIPGATRDTLRVANEGSCDMFIGGRWLITLEDICGWKSVGDPVFIQEMGFFVSQKMGMVAAFHNANLLQTGVRTAILEDGELPYPCRDDSAEDTSDFLSNNQLKPTHMLGNCMILGFCCGLSLLMNACMEAEKRVDKDVQRLKEVLAIQIKQLEKFDMPSYTPSAGGLSLDGASGVVASQIGQSAQLTDIDVTRLSVQGGEGTQEDAEPGRAG